MDINVSTDYLAANGIFCDVSIEQSVEGDFMIPDYQPEIFKIVKTLSEPVVMQKLAVGTRATVEGYVRLTVIYMAPESNGLYSFQQRLPFSKQIELKEDVGDAAKLLCSAGISYMNCRAINQRRLDVRGAVSLAVKGIGAAETELVSGVEGAGAQYLSQPVDFIKRLESGEKQFTLEETLEVENDLEYPLEIIRNGADVIIEYVDPKDGMVELGGYVAVNLTVSAALEDGVAAQRYGFNIPFKQLLDMELASEGAEVLANASVITLTLQTDSLESGLADVSVTCAVNVDIYAAQQGQVLVDVFSTRYETDIAFETLAVTDGIYGVSESFEINKSLDKPQPGGLVDFFVTDSTVGYEADADGGFLSGRLGFTILLAQPGDVVAFEMPLEYNVPIQLGDLGAAPLADLELVVKSIECTENDSSLTVKIAGGLFGSISSLKKFQAVKSVSLNELVPKQAGNYALSIYFGIAGENLWNIAKRYNTSLESILGENDLSGETLEFDTMLLIPIVDN